MEQGKDKKHDCDAHSYEGDFCDSFDIVGAASVISSFIVEQMRPEDIGVVTSLLNTVRDNILLIFAQRERRRRLEQKCRDDNARRKKRECEENIVEETEEEFRRS